MCPVGCCNELSISVFLQQKPTRKSCHLRAPPEQDPTAAAASGWVDMVPPPNPQEQPLHSREEFPTFLV